LVGGNTNGNLSTREVNEYCRPEFGGSCAGSKRVKTMVSCPVTYTLSASPSNVKPGEIVTVSWTSSRSRSSSDRIQLYKSLTPTGQYLASKRISGGTSGTVTFIMPSTTGSYEFRYITYEDSYVATSNTVEVTSQTPSPTAPPEESMFINEHILVFNLLSMIKIKVRDICRIHKKALRE
jgi:hypothetical protein